MPGDDHFAIPTSREVCPRKKKKKRYWEEKVIQLSNDVREFPLPLLSIVNMSSGEGGRSAK